MKIVHIAPSAPYNDYWGYQENLLPKYQAKLGHDVILFITNMMHRDGKIVETDCSDYVLTDNIRVVRMRQKQYLFTDLTHLCCRLPIWDYLLEVKPDFIFYHGLTGTTILDVIKYKKKVNRACVIVQDNHMDRNNTRNCEDIHNFTQWVRGKAFRTFSRMINRITIQYIHKVYGVTPWREKFAEDFFQIPKDKTDILIMGADDEKIDFENRNRIRDVIRLQYDIERNDFLIVSGGKIDKEKQIHHLMRACSELKNVKLLIFGQVSEDIRDILGELLENSKNIRYAGWVNADQVYNYFFAADLVVFPGGHSVLWEQACACKVPCVFKRWEGMEHVNNGGNSEFLDEVTPEAIKRKIEELKFTEKYNDMLKVAMSEKTDIYLYSNIAVKSLECWNER